MKVKGKKFAAGLLVMLTFSVLIACQKDDADSTSGQTSSTTPALTGTDGVLWAIQQSTTMTVMGYEVSVEAGSGVGAFVNSGKNVDAGTVKLNGNVLTNMSNSYLYTILPTQPEGINFSSGIKWDVSGGNGFAPFNHTVSKSFPVASGFSAASTLSSGSSYTISFTGVSGADSIIFVVNNIHKTVPGTTKSYTFTASQLSSLKAGPAAISAAPYNVTFATYGGKKIAFGTQVVYQKNITVN